MGIDPGLAKLGWGIIEVFENKQPVLIDYGCVSTVKTESFSNRLGIIYAKICSLIKEYNPEEISIEEIFFATNAKTAINVAQARGAVMLAFNHSGIKVCEYTPLQIKQALVGYGRAGKQQVQYMVKNFLKLKEIPSPDHAADALAAALCHNNSRKINRMVEGKK